MDHLRGIFAKRGITISAASLAAILSVEAVKAAPAGLAVAAIAAPERKLYGVQFHPEVVHTTRGKEYLQNFVFRVCECLPDWL